MSDRLVDRTHNPMAHGCPAGTDHDREVPDFDLLSPLTIRGVTFRNRRDVTRVSTSPRTAWRTTGIWFIWAVERQAARLVMVEASVTEHGRITPGDLGIWTDAHAEPLARIARFVHSQGSIRLGIQLAHAGRKASCDLPWNGGAGLMTPAAGGWPVVGPSAIAFDEGNPVPKALEPAEIDGIVAAFETACKRALRAGFRLIEIHAAHGYLWHEFLSPLSNRRTDSWAVASERMRLTAVRLQSPTTCRYSSAFREPTGPTAAGTSISQWFWRAG